MVKTGVKTAVKKYGAALAEGAPKAQQQLSAVSSVIDKAAAKGVLHRNTANRKKARLAKALNKTQAGA